MYTKIDQSLGDVQRSDTVLLLPTTGRHELVHARSIECHLVDVAELCAQIVRVQHRCFANVAQAAISLQGYVGERPDHDAEMAPEALELTNRLRAIPVQVQLVGAGAALPAANDRPGQEWFKRGGRDHRPAARPATAVRRRERLVGIDVEDVESEVSRLDGTEDRVQVGTVAVDQATSLVNRGRNV